MTWKCQRTEDGVPRVEATRVPPNTLARSDPEEPHLVRPEEDGPHEWEKLNTKNLLSQAKEEMEAAKGPRLSSTLPGCRAHRARAIRNMGGPRTAQAREVGLLAPRATRHPPDHSQP